VTNALERPVDCKLPEALNLKHDLAPGQDLIHPKAKKNETKFLKLAAIRLPQKPGMLHPLTIASLAVYLRTTRWHILVRDDNCERAAHK